MKRSSTSGAPSAAGPVGTALEEMTASFERFCLAAGLEALGALMAADATALCGPRHGPTAVSQVRIDFPCGSRRDSSAARVGGGGDACFRRILAGSVTPVCAA